MAEVVVLLLLLLLLLLGGVGNGFARTLPVEGGGLAGVNCSHRDGRGIIGQVSTPSGWLVVQRDLTGSVQVKDAPEIWFTAVFSTPSRKMAGGNADSTAHGSLVGAVRQAIHTLTRGAPSGPPAVVVASPGLVGRGT
jgi:hypothetical protein